jgi:hypothetical protein
MAYISLSPSTFLGKTVPDGQCVALVKKACSAPVTAFWKKGNQVKGDNKLKVGTAIATFSSKGKYENLTDGSSHAAIYMGQTATYISVIDQWSGQITHKRNIKFMDGVGKKVNDGSAYYVIK